MLEKIRLRFKMGKKAIDFIKKCRKWDSATLKRYEKTESAKMNIYFEDDIKKSLLFAYKKCNEMLGGKNNHDALQRIDEILLIYSDIFNVSVNKSIEEMEENSQ